MYETLNDGVGILVMEKITPVMEALFGSFHLHKIKREKNKFYISRRSRDPEPTWAQIRDRLSRLMPYFELEQPDKHCVHVVDYFDYMVRQMDDSSRFTDDQMFHLVEVLCTVDEECRVDFEQLFKFAMAFDDGHQLKSLSYQSAWHCHKPRLYRFGGDGFYATNDAVISTDTNLAVECAENVCRELGKNDIKEASKYVCNHLGYMLLRVFNKNVRKALIEQIAADLPQIAPVVFDMVEKEECGDD